MNDLTKNLRIGGIISLMVIASRFFIFLLAYCAFLYLHNKYAGFGTSFQQLWDRWDSGHYLFIAQHGYVATPENKAWIVFGPLFPFLIRAFYLFIHNFFWSGIIVSNLCLIIGSFFLYKLTQLDYDSETALRCVKYLLIYPFSFFFSIVYSESLFLMLFILSTYLIRRKKWPQAGICAMLAVLTRPNAGIFFLVIFFAEYFLYLRGKYLLENNLRSQWFKDIVLKSFVPACVVIGYLLYLLLNKVVLNDWLAFLTWETSSWGHHYSFLPQNIYSIIINMKNFDPHENICLWIPQLASFFIPTFLGLLAIKQLRASYIFYFFVYIFSIYSVYWLISGERYILMAFPLYMILGIFSKNKLVDFILTFTSLAFLAFYTIAFSNSSFVM